ncbi:Magnesium-transporting ATPase [Pseudomonas syringae pv. actinidiae]|uniref:Magnesium-transporting ATPase n=1 Tax=Pseudomonas syringae pv. actinidiae TaxID=103796 RepID=A0AAN4TJP8_PSESF|nr:Magnesium-transporting ATPase [Pseudomonas syringae pv. actinidiae]
MLGQEACFTWVIFSLCHQCVPELSPSENCLSVMGCFFFVNGFLEHVSEDSRCRCGGE